MEIEEIRCHKSKIAIGLSINGDIGEMMSLRHQGKPAPTVLEVRVQEIII